MSRDADWEGDLARYPRSPWFKERSIWSVAVYPFGRRVDRMEPGPGRWIGERCYRVAHAIVTTATGISIWKSVEIGPGLRIWHFGNVFVHHRVKIGRNCSLRQGVTIGIRRDRGPVPVVGDDVDFGAYAQVLGGVRIGNRARIGAMSVVLDDVPDGATAVGVPARIIPGRAAASPRAETGGE